VDSSTSPSPFVRSWWVDGIGAGPGDVLKIPLVFDGDELIGGIPLVQDRLAGTLPRLVSIDGSDYVDLVAAPDRELEVLKTLRRWLAGRRTLVEVVCRSGTAAIDLVPQPRWILARTVAPYEELSGSFDDYLANRTHKWRATVRKSQRATERRGWTVRLVDPGDIGAAVKRLTQLHGHQWVNSEFFRLSERFGSAARAGAARGEVVVFELVDGNVTLASQVWFEVAGCSYAYQTGRVPEAASAGIVLFAAAIERACRTGQRRVSFLGGDEAYKAHWASQAKNVFRVRGTTGRLLPYLASAIASRRGYVPWREGIIPATAPWPPDPVSASTTPTVET
jgi:CelD/BcsL family acetyltransferase involved in cellulose biosynthesis